MPASRADSTAEKPFTNASSSPELAKASSAAAAVSTASSAAEPDPVGGSAGAAPSTWPGILPNAMKVLTRLTGGLFVACPLYGGVVMRSATSVALARASAIRASISSPGSSPSAVASRSSFSISASS